MTIFSLQDMLDAQRKAEDRIRENEEWLRAIIDNTPTLISVKHPDGRYMTVNHSFENAFHVSALLAQGRSDAELFTPDVAEALRSHDDEVLSQNSCVEFDQTVTSGNGAGVRRFLFIKAPLHDVLGNVTGICSLATDVTERELVRQERARLFELSDDLMVVATFDGHIKLCNPRWEQVTGMTSQDIATRPGISLVHPDDRARGMRALESLREGKPLAHFTSRLRRKDGGYIEVDWRAMPAVEQGMIYCVGREIHEAQDATDEGTMNRDAQPRARPPRPRKAAAAGSGVPGGGTKS